MMTPEENDLLCRVEGDAPMGQIMRRHWIAACLSEEVAEPDGAPVKVRLAWDGSVQKGNVGAGSTASGNWAADLVLDEGGSFADFAEYLRPATIVGKFGQGSIPSLRNVPFRTALGISTSGGAGYWVGEGLAKPLTSFNFDKTFLEPLKCANIVVLTEELLMSSATNAEVLVRDEMRNALVELIDVAKLHELNREEVQNLLGKVSKLGIRSLSPAERQFLDRMSTRH